MIKNNLYSNNIHPLSYSSSNNYILLKQYFFSYNYPYNGYFPNRVYEYEPLPCCTLCSHLRYREFPYLYSFKDYLEHFPYFISNSFLFYKQHDHELKIVTSPKQKSNQGLAITYPTCSMAAIGMALNKEEVIFSNDEQYWEPIKL